MKGGPKPLPLSIKALFDGMPADKMEQMIEQRRLVPEAKDGELVPSQSFAVDHRKMEFFNFYKTQVGTGHLKPMDVPLLEMLCNWQVLWQRIMDEYLDAPGSLLGKAANGGEILSPYFTMMKHASDTVRKLTAELGMTPAERARMKGPGLQGDDEKTKLKRELVQKYELGAG